MIWTSDSVYLDIMILLFEDELMVVGVALAYSFKESIQYTIRKDLSIFNSHVFESLFVEISGKSVHKYVVGVIYRPNTAPMCSVDVFSSTLHSIMDTIMGDMNIDLLTLKHNLRLTNLYSRGFQPVITKPTVSAHLVPL